MVKKAAKTKVEAAPVEPVNGESAPPQETAEQEEARAAQEEAAAAVAEAADEMADAQAVLDAATKRHEAAVADHAATVKAPVKLDPDKYFLVEGDPTPREWPKGEERSRRLLLGGYNFEHVTDNIHGVWVFRQLR